MVDRLPLLGHEPKERFSNDTWHQLLPGFDLPVRRAVRGDPEVRLLICMNDEMLRAPFPGALFCARGPVVGRWASGRVRVQAASDRERLQIPIRGGASRVGEARGTGWAG